ncbi:MAG: hypothetical protein J0I44_12165 [Microbacterium sp.]|uniref:hypothetical protein n=1 Tax=Microbacterium sp. TaxID=51671 RepID=UPI001AC6D3A2|nr:hypothetical protein [Microbacterium sp.]MBN9153746.1 hypothetical protein [Microbacterium sp.]MBN9170515.1 hypothetical protein [Microbacterium sp.]MBN9173992.1 hypothetical protein [Microbacterium sp.]MBN9184232.1 hypothetical protein [Microbacterium sp.]MBN9189052.1 hypothetical protein [Microbacterium sp.]
MASDHEAMRRAHEHFDPIAEHELTLPDVDMGRMFSTDGLRIRGKVYAFIAHDGTLVVKLPQPRIDELADGGGIDHMRMRGREMREWATVPLAYAATWDGLVTEAHDFVASLAGD